MTDEAGRRTREVAAEALNRIEGGGAFANLVLGPTLERSGLDERDRRFVTELVYGTTRMRRACDFLVDRFLMREVDEAVRTLLRLGAYQLQYMQVPSHAAVDATVGIAPKKVKGLINAVLRKVASTPPNWPGIGVELSYPEWIVDRLAADHDEAEAVTAMRIMNTSPQVVERSDGYVQDTASQWVAEAVGAEEGETVLDLCAAPGGKATILAAAKASVVAADRRPSRLRLVEKNMTRVDQTALGFVAADGAFAPFRPASFDRVLVDAPCSGLGVLRRRADARWRMDVEGVDRLAALQGRLLAAAAPLVKPGGTLVYSVCTVTRSETIDVTEGAKEPLESFEPVALDGERWRPWGTGGLLLPQDHDTDGMALYVWRRTG